MESDYDALPTATARVRPYHIRRNRLPGSCIVGTGLAPVLVPGSCIVGTGLAPVLVPRALAFAACPYSRLVYLMSLPMALQKYI